jgi:hypothetical protein
MNVKFADSFGDSIKKLIQHQTWWYKTYELFRYDLPRFTKNVWTFRKALWSHYWFDHHGTLKFLEIGLTNISDTIEKYGNEVDGPRLKKVAAMRRAVELIKNYNESNYIEMAEKELGEIIHHEWEFEETGDTTDNPMGKKNEKLYQLVDKDTPEEKEHNSKVYSRSREIEEQEWEELFKILKGQDYAEYRKLHEAQTEEEKRERELWNEWFDGSGLKGWWD